MVSKLESLPREIQQTIVSKFIEFDGSDKWHPWYLENWSLTCSYYRKFLSPWYHERVRLGLSVQKCRTHGIVHGHAKTSSMVRAVAECSEVAVSVKTLELCGNLNFKCENADHEMNIHHILYPDLEYVLSNLSRFPNLETLKIELSSNWDWKKISEFDSGETSQQVQEAESKECWRALLARIYDRIARNPGGSLRRLVIHKWVMKEVSTFSTVLWHQFLSSLDSFELNIPGGSAGGWWDIAGYGGYQDLTPKLDQIFFNHLKNATRFVLHPHHTGVLGPLAPLPLRQEHLPKIRYLELSNVWIGQDIVDFFVERSSVIENITMRDVSTSTWYPGDHQWDFGHVAWRGNITWAQFLDALAQAKPQRLRTFDIENVSYWPKYWDYKWNEDDPDEGLKDTAKVKEILKECPDRILFLYGTIQDKYKYREDRDDRNGTIAHFLLEEDQKAYDRLMGSLANERTPKVTPDC